MRVLVGDDFMAGRGVISRVLGAGATTLSAEQVAALKAEIGKPAYAGMSVAEVCDALNLPAQVENPEPQGQVRSSTTIGALKDWWRPLLAAVSDVPKRDKWLAVSGARLSQYTDGYVVEYDAEMFVPLRLGALADKVIAQADMDALMPLIPDPAYLPTFWVAISDTLFGTGALVEASDLAGLA
jgi:hypothetical protein